MARNLAFSTAFAFFLLPLLRFGPFFARNGMLMRSATARTSISVKFALKTVLQQPEQYPRVFSAISLMTSSSHQSFLHDE